MRIPCVGNIIPGKLSLTREQNILQNVCNRDFSHSQNLTQHDLLARVVVLFGGGNPQITVFMLRQSHSRTGLSVGFAVLTPGYESQLHVLYSLVRRNQPPTKFCVYSQMFCDVEFCEVGVVAGIPQEQPNHFHWRNRIRNASPLVLHL